MGLMSRAKSIFTFAGGGNDTAFVEMMELVSSAKHKPGIKAAAYNRTMHPTNPSANFVLLVVVVLVLDLSACFEREEEEEEENDCPGGEIRGCGFKRKSRD
jgi:hypothetical protein